MKELLGKDMRLTNQRKIILEELRAVTTHPTADEVYGMVRKRMPRISLGTVYRNLEVLIVNKIDLLPYVRFNMDYFRQGVEMLNPGLRTFPVSCVTQEGIDAWAGWLN